MMVAEPLGAEQEALRRGAAALLARGAAAYGVSASAAEAMAGPAGPSRHLHAACVAPAPSAKLSALTRLCEEAARAEARELDADEMLPLVALALAHALGAIARLVG